MPPTPVLLREARYVPMRDGVLMAVHVTRPGGAVPVPAIVGYTPYRQGPLGTGPDPLVERGYARVTWDIRGTGDSAGWNDAIYSDAERQDGYDLIEWVAAQPWCNGRVGITGISFGGVVALQQLGAAPPHLAATIVRSGTDDPFTEWTNPGGSPRPYIYACYAAIMTAFNFAPPDPAALGARWEAVWQERLEHNVPWGIAFLQHLCDGPFWRARSLRGRYDRVRAAAFVVDGWADWYHNPLLRTFANLRGPKRALIGPWSHQFPDAGIPGPRVDWAHEAGRWWDQWLKDQPTGITAEPPVTLFVRHWRAPAAVVAEEAGEFRTFADWPPPGMTPRTLYLAADQCLRRNAGPAASEPLPVDPRVGATTGFHGGGPFNVNYAMPLDQRPDEALMLTWTTPPLSAAQDVIGQPRVVLYVAADAPTAQVVVKLCDVAPDGAVALVTKGWLNLAYRDPGAAPTPLEPGTVYEVTIDLLTCAYRCAAGHRLRLSLAGADLLNLWPTPDPVTLTVYRGRGRPSHLLLPVVPETAAPPPSLRPAPPGPDQAALLGDAPVWTVTHDPIRETAGFAYQVNYGPHLAHRATYTVSARDPAAVHCRGEATFTQEYPNRRVVVQAVATTTSDHATFRHQVELLVTLNGTTRCQRQWDVSVPRPGVAAPAESR